MNVGLRLRSIDANAWRVITYDKGTWVIRMLAERLGPERLLSSNERCCSVAWAGACQTRWSAKRRRSIYRTTIPTPPLSYSSIPGCTAWVCHGLRLIARRTANLSCDRPASARISAQMCPSGSQPPEHPIPCCGFDRAQMGPPCRALGQGDRIASGPVRFPVPGWRDEHPVNLFESASSLRQSV